MNLVYSILGTFNSGGMERVLTNKANYFVNLGYSVTIITTDQKNRTAYFELDPKIVCIDLGINYTDDTDKSVLIKVFSFIAKQHKHYLALKKELLKIKPDVVISMFDNDSTFLYKIKDGSKKVLEIHFSRYKRLQYGRAGLLKWIDLYRSKQDLSIAKKYDRFVVLTDEDKSYWGTLSNIEVIPNANSFIPSRHALLEQKKALAIGRFDYQKGFEDLIQAWQIIHVRSPDWILNIYGHGPLKDKFEGLIDSLNLKSTVFLKEPRKDVEAVYLDHSILAMTSRYEGLPMVLLEAQSCGLPLVAYACKCGPRDIIHENGILVEEGNIASMADSLLRLTQDIDLRMKMGAFSRDNASYFTEEKIMIKWVKLFDSLIH